MTETPLETDLRTLPYRWYTDPRVAEIERAAIFRRTWQYAGHVGELAGPGSFFPTHAGGVPVVVTLDADGALRAFVNVCRHRGALVASAPARRSGSAPRTSRSSRRCRPERAAARWRTGGCSARRRC